MTILPFSWSTNSSNCNMGLGLKVMPIPFVIPSHWMKILSNFFYNCFVCNITFSNFRSSMWQLVFASSYNVCPWIAISYLSSTKVLHLSNFFSNRRKVSSPSWTLNSSGIVLVSVAVTLAHHYLPPYLFPINIIQNVGVWAW